MNKPSINIQDEIITVTTKTFEMFGLTPVESQLFIYLYLTDRLQTLDDMSEALGKSKTSMSTSVRKLADLNLVSQVWKRGVRKDLYTSTDQTFSTLVNVYMQNLTDTVRRQKEALEELELKVRHHNHNNVSAEEMSDTELLDKLNNIIGFHTDLQNIFKHLENTEKTI
jgi:DNA-binding transcriptional regulator GbsR (MarR family)